MANLSHEVLLALAYVSQISDPAAIISRFIESLNALDKAYAFEFTERIPPDVPPESVFPITTMRAAFGYAVMRTGPDTSEINRSVFRTAFQFLAVLLENRTQTRTLESNNVSLLREVRQEQSLVHAVLDTLPVGVWVTDGDGSLLMENAAGGEIWGCKHPLGAEPCGGLNAWSADTGQRIAPEDWIVERVLRSGQAILDETIDIECLDGSRKTLLISAAPFRDDDGHIIGTVCINQDITERKQAIEDLRESEERFRNVFDNHSAVKLLLDPDTGSIIEANKAAVAFYGWTYVQIKQMRIQQISTLSPEDIKAAMDRVYADKPAYFEFRHRRADGSIRDVEVYSSRIEEKGRSLIHSIVHDATERKRTEEEKAKLQEQLAQAQKMESIGRLAGGVAHDFNNMLGVIIGHTEMAMEELDPSHSLYKGLQEIHKAAVRSAELTGQLLAFARKQTVSPKVLPINETIEGMLKMLQRLIGEDIHLAWMPGPDPWPVRIDPTQIDQILANLCVNARDAISGVGKMTIETGNVSLDEAYCRDHAGFVPGDYVLLAVSDNGCGMNKEIMGKLFEPFFTTKETGKGTGLGLAMIYGIVRQNNGFINVYSEPEQGTTFRIYLPRHAGKEELRTAQGHAMPAKGGRETILVVEDEPAILEMTKRMLKKHGYQVLTAAIPSEAIRLAKEHTGPIHLLLTDVVMPEMNGRDLAQKILSIFPDLKCLFTSGYTANVIAHHGVLNDGVFFIPKPFSRNDLAAKVREVLGTDL